MDGANDVLQTGYEECVGKKFHFSTDDQICKFVIFINIENVVHYLKLFTWPLKIICCFKGVSSKIHQNREK